MRRRGFVAAALLFAGACGVYWAGSSDDPPAGDPSSVELESSSWIVDIILNIVDKPSGPRPSMPLGHVTPAQREALNREAMELDAGLVAAAAWARALAPLMAAASAPSPSSDAGPPLRFDAGVPAHDAGFTSHDAGFTSHDAGGRPPRCIPTARLEMVDKQLDLVVAIDTSSSMRAELPSVIDWLKSLESTRANAKIDVRLEVLADLSPRAFALPAWTAPKGTTHNVQFVDSNDVLEVILNNARSGSGWLQRLRPDASANLILVTDDNPSPELASSFMKQIIQAGAGRLGTEAAPKLRIHGLLAYQSPEAITPPEAPFETKRCGGRPGIAYQKIIRDTGGVRGSMCRPDSFHKLADAIFAKTDPTPSCGLSLPLGFPVDRAFNSFAIGSDGRRRTLYQAFEPWQCDFSTDRYRLEGTAFALCPSSCKALLDDAFVRVEFESVCPY